MLAVIYHQRGIISLAKLILKQFLVVFQSKKIINASVFYIRFHQKSEHLLSAFIFCFSYFSLFDYALSSAYFLRIDEIKALAIVVGDDQHRRHIVCLSQFFNINFNDRFTGFNTVTLFLA